MVKLAGTVCDEIREVHMRKTSDHGLTWLSSPTCADNACVEVAGEGEHIYVRDGKVPDDGVLRFTRAEWDAFLTGAKAGDFDSV